MSAFDRLVEAFRERLDSIIAQAPDYFFALVVLAIFVVAGRLIGRGVDGLLSRGRLSSTHRAFFRGLVVWIVALVGFAFALSIVGLGGIAAGLVTSGGITAIVIGFAFRGIGENLLAGFFLAFSRPFEVGDYIESEGLAGTVRGIELRSTHIRTPDGRDIYIPSAQIFGSPVINYTKDGYRRPKFTLGVDYRDDLPGARRLLESTLGGVDGVLENPAPQVAAADTLDNHVAIEVAFWIDTRDTQLVGVKGRAIEACVAALGGAGYTFSSEVTTGVQLMSAPDDAGPQARPEA